MIKRSIRYFALALSLVAFTSASQNLSAQSSCSDSNSCVVTGGDPEPMSSTRIILLILQTVLLP